MKTRKRAFAFGSLLILVVLLGVLGMAVASIATTQWMLVSRSSTVDVLRSHADAVLASAIARIQNDNTYAAEITKTMKGAPAGCEGRLTFDKASGEPYSTNNLEGKTAVEGWNKTVVPPQAVHLVSRGVLGNDQKVMEAIIFVPRYPYVVSSSGSVDSKGGLEVEAVETLDAISAGVDNIAAADKRPGQLVANGADTAGSKALSLDGAGIKVHGDVQSADSAEVKNGAVVTGEVREKSEKTPLPKIDLSQYDPAGTPGLTEYDTNLLDSITIEGYARRTGDLKFTNGLKLDGGVLYVNGNLEVEGGVSGTGAIIVQGSTAITGGGSLATDSKMALLSKGQLTINGSASQRAEFRGIVYTEANFLAENVNLLGSFVSNTDGNNKMDISNAKVISVPDLTKLGFTIKGQPGTFSSTGGDGTVTLTVGPTATAGQMTDGQNVLGSMAGSPAATYYVDAYGQARVDSPTGTVVPVDSLPPAVQAQLQDMMSSRNAAVTTTTTTALTTTTLYPGIAARSWALDLSRFVNLSDSLKVKLWREV